MKTINLIHVNLLTIFCLGMSSSFTIPSEKSLSETCYCYNPPQSDCYKKREIDCIGPLAIVPSELNNASYWNPCDLLITYSVNGLYLRKICFAEEFDEDGPCDGELTLQEAIDAVRAYFDTHSCTLPQDGQVITVGTECTATILIKRSNSNCP